jgi:pimeloyl-ACP methyl ester carboxylesterase
MKTLISRDGTLIAYETVGQGQPIVLVDGAFGHRGFGPNPALAKALAVDHKVVTYDRRGRGASGDTQNQSKTRSRSRTSCLTSVATVSEKLRIFWTDGSLTSAVSGRIREPRPRGQLC